MPIDYQQILMDMNRPRNRQSGSGKRYLIVMLMLGMAAGGGYAIWHYGVVSRAMQAGTALASRYWPGTSAPATEPNNAPESVSVRPESVMAQVAPATGGQAIPVAHVAVPDAARTAAAPSAAQSVAAGSASNLRPSASSGGFAAAPAAREPSAVRTGTPDAMPVLSDARAQIRVIDQMLADNPAEALRRVELLIATGLKDDEAAEAGYRLGYAARMIRDEDKAEKSWKETAEKYPSMRGGRYSALALADTWFSKYAAERPQMSYWDDIQKLYSQVISTDDAPFLPESVRDKVKSNLKTLNDSLFFGSAPSKMARYHKVETGELLGSIASKYRVDYESIARINGINPNRIRAGMDLKLMTGEVSVIVRKNSGDPDKAPTVTWYLDDRWVREYPSCVGEGIKTPAGTYTLVSKERDPSWTNPSNGQLLPNDHPENILGSRWMAMKGMDTQGLGIHGTTVDDSIPGYTSAGCIRLLNRDVEELFSFARIGGKVTVIE